MNKTRNNGLRAWLTALCAAAFCLLGTQTAWGQTMQGVVVDANVTTVKDGETDKAITVGTGGNVGILRAEATSGNTVTVAVEPPSDGKVAVVTVSPITIAAESITVTSAGDVTEMNGNAQLQMSATIEPTYADNKTVTWSVASAAGSSATATIDASTGLLRAGTVQGDVVVTAMAADGSAVSDSKTITITTIPLTADMITVAATSYTGSALTPTVTVNDGTRDLVQGTDFTLAWKDNVDAGTNTAKVTVTGMGAYTGSIEKTFSIAKGNQSPSINDRQFNIAGMSCTLSGSYNTSGTFQLQVYNNNTWNNVTTGTEIYQGKFRVYNSVIVMITGNPQWRLLISGNDNWNDYTSGNLR